MSVVAAAATPTPVAVVGDVAAVVEWTPAAASAAAARLSTCRRNTAFTSSDTLAIGTAASPSSSGSSSLSLDRLLLKSIFVKLFSEKNGGSAERERNVNMAEDSH